jgi:hypothetical protein
MRARALATITRSLAVYVAIVVACDKCPRGIWEDPPSEVILKRRLDPSIQPCGRRAKNPR